MFGKALNSLRAPRDGIFDIITDDAEICLCEEATASDIRAAASDGARDINDLKRRTRLGMGHCQGCFCCLAANELLARCAGSQPPPGAVHPPHPREAGSIRGHRGPGSR